MEKKKKLLIEIIILCLFISIITISYAYFTAKVNGNGNNFIIFSGTMKLEYNDGRKIELNNAIPGSSVTKEFSVKNIGTVNASYNVWLTQVLNNFRDTSDLAYTLVSDEANVNISSTEVPSVDEAITSDVEIESNQIHNYRLTITFLNKNENQDDNKGVSFSALIDLNNYNYEQDIAQIRQYIAVANEYYQNNPTSSLLGTNLISELNLDNIKSGDQIVITNNGQVEVSVSKNNRCYKKSALSDDIDVMENESCDVDATRFASNNGKLHVSGSKLLNEKNEVIRLTGTGLETNYSINPQFYSSKSLSSLRNWGGNVFRLFVEANKNYPSTYVYQENTDEYLDCLKEAIDNAIANDMYVIINWNPGSTPKTSDAIAFFKIIANMYPNDPHIIYELWNEPYGSSTTWNTITTYANAAIPEIRAISPDAVVLVGTTDMDKNINEVINNELNFNNVMYTFHMYQSSFTDENIQILQDAIDADLPIFVSEWSASSLDNDVVNLDEIAEAFATSFAKLLKQHDISYSYFVFSSGDLSYCLTPANTWDESLPNKILKNGAKFFKKILRDDYEYSTYVMKGNNVESDNGNYYRDSQYRNLITTVAFKNTLSVPNDAVVSWDLSAIGDGSVMGYLVNSTEESGMYDLVICADGYINLPRNSANLFRGLSNVKSYDFTYAKSDYVLNMNNLFYKNTMLESLDLSYLGNNLSLKYMYNTFMFDTNLKSINFANWTPKIVGLINTFSGCSSLESVDLSGFNAENLDNISSMFQNNTSLKYVNISTWNPKKMNKMVNTFSNCTSLEYVDMSSMYIYDDTDVLGVVGGVNGATFVVRGEDIYNLLVSNSTNYSITPTYSSKYSTGTTGDVSWSFNPASQTLAIDGNGAMADYDSIESTPWFQYKDYIKNIVIGENVTKLGKYAFYDLTEVREFRINAKSLENLTRSETNIGDNFTLYNTGKHFNMTLVFGSNVERIPAMLMRPFGPNDYTYVNRVLFEGNKITEVGYWGLAQLKVDSLVLKEGISQVAGLSFGYGSFKLLVLPNSLYNVGGWSINANALVEKIVYGSSLKDVPSMMFPSNTKIREIVMPHVDDTTANNIEPFSKISHDVVVYGDDSTRIWVDNSKTLSGKSNIIYKNISEYSSSITSNSGINTSVGYNGTYTFSTSGNVKVRYKYIASDGSTIYSEELDVEKNGNNYTINNIKQDVYIEIN